MHWIWWVLIIGLLFMFIIPGSFKCKLYFWDKNACQKMEQGAQLFNQLTGETISTDLPPILSIDNAIQGIRKPAN